MKLHLTTTSSHVIPVLADYVFNDVRGYPYSLLSFAYEGMESSYAKTWVRKDCEIILDSGAFTAWSAGRQVSVRDYLKWATSFKKRNGHNFAKIRYINLDTIPGTKGTSATPEQIEQACKSSASNADFLRVNGIDAIEVFHQDEPFEILKNIVERANGRLIAISPRNDVSVQQRQKWLVRVLKYCVKTFGKSDIPPAHGLAVTSKALVMAFPFYSVDSSSWTASCRFGHVGQSGLPSIPTVKQEPDREKFKAIMEYALKKEIKKFDDMAKEVTGWWQRRGIVWDKDYI